MTGSTDQAQRWRAPGVPAGPRPFAAGLLALVSLMVPCAWGGSGDGGADLARRLRAEGVIRPLEDFLRQAQSVRPGTLIDARLHFEREHGTYVYEIYMLDQTGDLWEVEFDARSGEMLEVEPEDP